MGDPAGVGPEVTAKALLKKEIYEICRPIVIGDADVMTKALDMFKVPLEINPVKDVSEHTGFPEMMDGRLKTLHPKVHGGLLWRRDNPKDKEEVEKHNIESIDMVVVNLYPFEQTVS